MKLFKKLLFVLFLGVVLFIMFYPNSNENIRIDGHWTVSRVRIDSNAIPLDAYVNIYNDRLVMDEYSLFRKDYKYTIVGDSIFFTSVKDTLSAILAPQKEGIFNGNYKLKQHSKIVGSGKNAVYDRQLDLISKNKVIILNRTDEVMWEEGLPRGRP